MNLYLLRVGADSTKLGGGFYSHICPKSKSYVFIPIPDEIENLIENPSTYQDYSQNCIWNNEPVLDYLPLQIRKVPNEYYVHNDPEFKTFTYGSPRYNRNGSVEKNYRKLAGMQEGDMLTFYAAFTSNGHDIHGYYFFAYFIIVDRAITFDNPDELTEQQRAVVKNNHHFIHRIKLPNQVIVKGCRKQSRLFRKAVLLSSHKDGGEGRNYRPCRRVQNLLGGYNKSMNRSSIRRFNNLTVNNLTECEIARFRQYLDDNAGMINEG